MTNVIALLYLSNLFLKNTSPGGLGLAASVISHIGLESQFLSGLLREQDFCDSSVSPLCCLCVLLNALVLWERVWFWEGVDCIILPFLIFLSLF